MLLNKITLAMAVTAILGAGANYASAQTSGMSGTSGSGSSSSFGSSGSSSSSFGSGSFTGTGGGSFTGGTSGSSFTGGGATGNTAGTGGAGGRLGGASGSSGYPGVSTMNPFYAYYANPFAAGLPSTSGLGSTTTTTRTAAYGTPLYGATSNSMSTGTANISGTNQGYPGSNSIGIRRAPAYTTAIAFERMPIRPTAVRADVQAILAKSSRIASKDTIIVAMEGDGVVLRGLAKDDHERRLAEALVRLTPGVHNVRNELAVPEPAPTPRRVPE